MLLKIKFEVLGVLLMLQKSRHFRAGFVPLSVESTSIEKNAYMLFK